MNIEIRIARRLYEKIRLDLARPHAHAYERVGFLFCRSASQGRIQVVVGYEPVDDEHYIEDDRVGAKISSAAIRRAMQRGLDIGEGIFHVHEHMGLGLPSFSATDEKGLFDMVPSFQAIRPESVHGGILFSEDAGVARIWRPNSREPIFARTISVVGFPLEIWVNEDAK